MKNKKAQATMEFLMTYGWAILVIILAIGALAYFRPSIRNNMFELKAKDSDVNYINSIRNSTNNRIDKIEDRMYEVEQYERDIRSLKEKLESIQKQRLSIWVEENNYNNFNYPDHIGTDETFEIMEIKANFVSIQFNEGKYAIQLNSDNTFECFEKSNLKWKKISCEDTKSQEKKVIENA